MTPADVISIVSRIHKISEQELRGRKRQARIVAARHAAMVYMRQYCGISLANIGEIFARDHTTVMHALGAHRARVAADPAAHALDIVARHQIQHVIREDIPPPVAKAMGF